MSPDPVLSLIVSSYNHQAWFPLTLLSAMNQQAEVPFELLVCDDGSNDGGFDRIRQVVVSRDVDIRYIWQPDRGFRLSRSRNNGIRCARGRILVFVDGDSWLTPTFLNDHWRAHQESPSLVCGMRWTVFTAEERLTTLDVSALDDIPHAEEPEHVCQRWWFASDRPWMACLGGNFSVPSSPDGYFDERFESWGSEDRDLACRLCRAGLRPRLLDQPNAIHVRLPDHTVAHMDHDAVVAFIRNKLLLYNKYPGGELAPSVDLVTRCQLEPETERWSMGPVCRDISPEDVFREFCAWQARHTGDPKNGDGKQPGFSQGSVGRIHDGITPGARLC